MKRKSWKDRIHHLFKKHDKRFMNNELEELPKKEPLISLVSIPTNEEHAQRIWDNRTANELKEEHIRVRIARRVYQYRKEKGISQSTLGKSVGVAQSIISRMELSLYSYSNLDVLKRIATALEQPLINFLKDEYET